MPHFLPDIGNRAHHGHVVAFAALLAPIVAVVAPLGLDAADSRLLISPHGALSYVPFALLSSTMKIGWR